MKRIVFLMIIALSMVVYGQYSQCTRGVVYFEDSPGSITGETYNIYLDNNIYQPVYSDPAHPYPFNFTGYDLIGSVDLPAYISYIYLRVLESSGIVDSIYSSAQGPDCEGYWISGTFSLSSSSLVFHEMPSVPGTRVRERLCTSINSRLSVFPNPSNREVMIEGVGNIMIFDLNGRLVKTLESDGRVFWDGKNEEGIPLPTGSYYVTNGEYGNSKKLVFLK